MAATAPAFDPSKPFTRVSDPAQPAVPQFDPSKPFTKSPAGLAGASGGASDAAAAPGSGVPSAPAQPSKPSAAYGINRTGTYAQGAQKPTFDDFMQGAEAWARGASFGTSDDASAAIAAAILKAKGNPHTMEQLYEALDNEENQRIDSYEAKNGKSAEYLGMVTGPGGIGRLAEWIGRGATGLTRAARAALVGAGTGAVSGAGYAKPGEKERGAALGAAAGTVAGPIFQRAGEFFAPRISAAAQRYLAQGGVPTKAQAVGGALKATEEKASSLPIVGPMIRDQQRAAINQFNRITLNRVLEPLGQQVGDIGRDAYQHIDQVLSDGYDNLLPHLTFTADRQFQTDIAAVDAAAGNLPEAQQQRYINIMNSQFAQKLRGGTTMNGETFKGMESELRRLSSGLMSDQSFDNRELGQLLQQALQVSRSSLARTNATYAPQLRALNESYARFVRLRGAMSMLGAEDGIFTPAQLMNSIKKFDQSRGKGATAQGDALMQDLAEPAKAVLGNKYPDSGTAGRLGLMHLLNPKVAAASAAAALPYAVPLAFGRGYYLSPFSQNLGALLQQLPARAPDMAAGEVYQLTPDGRRYIGAQ